MATNKPKTYPTFDEWWNEIENFSTRGERAIDELGPNAEKWLKHAWALGWCCAENTADGFSSEAMLEASNYDPDDFGGERETAFHKECRSIINNNIAKTLIEHGVETI